jgi:lipopolysaccharide export system permease protein
MDFRTDYSAILLREGAFNMVSEGITVYIRAREQNGELQGLIVHDNRDKMRTVTIMAERGALAQTEEGPRVIMVNGNRQLIEKDTGKLSLLYFDRYSVDIGRPGAGETAQDAVRWREPRERFIYELLFPGDNPNDQRFYNRLRAEGHNRLTAPLYALAFAMIALATLLSGDHNRRGQARRVILAICLAVAVQSGAVLVSGLAGRSGAMLPLIWLNVLAPIVLGTWWLFRVPRRRRPRELVPEGEPA